VIPFKMWHLSLELTTPTVLMADARWNELDFNFFSLAVMTIVMKNVSQILCCHQCAHLAQETKTRQVMNKVRFFFFGKKPAICYRMFLLEFVFLVLNCWEKQYTGVKNVLLIIRNYPDSDTDIDLDIFTDTDMDLDIFTDTNVDIVFIS
jgi:hypothetical protein